MDGVFNSANVLSDHLSFSRYETFFSQITTSLEIFLCVLIPIRDHLIDNILIYNIDRTLRAL